MAILRLTQFDLGDDRYRVEIGLEGLGARNAPHGEFAFAMSEQDRNDLQWYLEDYLQHPHDPAPVIAARIEDRIRQLGCELFSKLFEGDGARNRDVMRLWDRGSPRHECLG